MKYFRNRKQINNSFTKNPPDETGRSSITIYDNSSPFFIINQIPIKIGNVRTEFCNLAYPSRKSKVHKIYIKNDTASLFFEPKHMVFTNINHFAYEFKNHPRK